jgi:antitoxin HicB
VLRFSYPAQLERGEAEGVTVVSFPDVPEAITEGTTLSEARAMASDALGLALLAYVRDRRALPRPSPRGSMEMVSVEPDVAAKLALIAAFNESRVTRRELARRLGKDEKEIRRMLDPMHPTKLAALSAALAELGQRLVVTVEPFRGRAA